MPECPGTQSTSGAMLWQRRLRALLLIRLASRCPGSGCRCAARRVVACELLKTATVFTPCFCIVALFSIAMSSASPIAHSLGSKTTMRPVPRKLRRDFHSFGCLHTAAAPTRPWCECDPSVHHIQTPAPTLASFSLAQRCAALLAAVVSSCMVVLTAGSQPGASQFMPSVVRPCSYSFLTALHIGAPEEGFLGSSFSLLLHAFSILAASRCCLESKISGAGVSPDSLISAPRGVMGSAPRMDLSFRLSGSWRLSRLTTSLGSHQSSLPYSATAWTHATRTALTVSGTTPYVLVRVRSLASAALALVMHRLWCSLNVRCASIHTPSQRVACALNHTDSFPTLIFAVCVGRRYFWWPRLRVNSAASVFAVSKCSPRLLAHSMLFSAHLGSIEMTWLTSLPVATQPRSSTTDSPSAADTCSSTHLISPVVQIAKRIGDTGEPRGTPASTGYHSIALPSITISTVLSNRKLSVHRIRSPSICLSFIKLTNLRLATLGKAALMSM